MCDDSGDDYTALRKRVQHLKQQHVQAVHQQSVHREVDVAAIASRCAQLEALNAALTAENEKLNQQLRANTERAAKLRRHQEKEQQKLREQVEALSSAATSVDATWASKLAAAEAAAAVKVQQLEAEIARLKQEQAEEEARLRTQHEASLKDIDEWCRGEIEAVQHTVRAQVAQAHQAVEHWQNQYDEVAAAQKSLIDANGVLEQEIGQLRRAQQELEEEVRQANTALMRLTKQHADEQARFEDEKHALIQRHAEQRAVALRAAKTEEAEVSTNGVTAPEAAQSANMLQFEELSDIIRLVHDTDIVEFELKSKRFSLSVRKKEALQAEQAAAFQMLAPVAAAPVAPIPVAAPAPAPVPAAAPAPPAAAPAAPAPAPAAAPAAPKGVEIVSPMAGTFYRKPAPGEPMFCKEGDKVKKGQTVCIIEAMKLMNEIEAEVGGEVIKFLVENGQPVAVGQPIMLIKP